MQPWSRGLPSDPRGWRVVVVTGCWVGVDDGHWVFCIWKSHGNILKLPNWSKHHPIRWPFMYGGAGYLYRSNMVYHCWVDWPFCLARLSEQESVFDKSHVKCNISIPNFKISPCFTTNHGEFLDGGLYQASHSQVCLLAESQMCMPPFTHQQPWPSVIYGSWLRMALACQPKLRVVFDS